MELKTAAGWIIVIMSFILFCAMGIDKKRARASRWRISEKTLFILAVMGGAPGGCAGMWLFRHKTKHWYFKLGFPLLAALQLAACFCL